MTPSLTLITPAADDAVDFDLLKDSLNVDYTDKDALIQVYLTAATDDAEKFTGRALIDQTWDVYFDGFPAQVCGWDAIRNDLNSIAIPKPPLIEVVGVFYQDSAGAEQELTDFLVEPIEPARLFLSTAASWPSPRLVPGSVRVRFRAGYLDSNSPPGNAVPYKIQAAIMLYTRAYFDGGEDADKLRASAENLLRPYRVERGMA